MMHALALKPHALVELPGWHWPAESQQPVEHVLELHGLVGIPQAAPVITRHASRERS